MFYLYVLTFPSGRRYVGMTSNFCARMQFHVGEANKGKETPVYRAIRKYGWHNVTKEVVTTGTREEVQCLELLATTVLETVVPDGYNVVPGGGFVSPMTYPHISAKLCGRVVSQATRKKNAEVARRRSERYKRLGIPFPKWSKEAKERHRVVMRNVLSSTETRRKISASHKGMRPNAETRMKMSAAQKRLWADASYLAKMMPRLRAGTRTEAA